MSSYRDGRPWDGGPPGAEQDYSGQQYAAPVPATDPWTGVSYAQYANYDYSAYGQHGYNYGYDPSYYQQGDNYYGGNKGYPPQASYGMQSSNPQPGGSTSKTYRSRSRSHSSHSRQTRSYSRSRGSRDKSRSGSRSKKSKLKRYSRSSSRSYSRSPIKVKKEKSTASPQYTDTFKKQKVIIKKEKKSRSRSPGPKDTKYSSRDAKIPPSSDKKILKKERVSVSPPKATSSKTASRSLLKGMTPDTSNTGKLNKHRCRTPPIKERSVTPPKCYARGRSLSASSSRSARSSSRSSRASRYSRASGSRSRSRSTHLSRNKARRKRSQSRSPSRHRGTPSRSRSRSRRRITKSRSSSASDRHNIRSRSNSRLHTRSRHRPSKSRSQSRRRSSRSVSKSRHSRSGSRHRQSRSRSKSRQKVGKTNSKSRRSVSKSRDRRSSRSASRSRSRSNDDDDERRGQFTVADRKRFWKRHRTRIEDKVRTPPKEIKPPPGVVEATSVDDIEYNVPPDLVGPNFADLLTIDHQLPSTSKKVPLPIRNDGSFLEMFKKMQEETKKAEEAEKKPEIKKPVLPFIGKRRGGRVLKTGLVKKARAIDEQAADAPKDAWSLYMQEVKKYRETSCEEERKTRPLVK